MNTVVMHWYLQQIIAYIGFLTSILLLIIIVKKLKAATSATLFPLSFKVSTYAVYITAPFYFFWAAAVPTALPLFRQISPQTDQVSICNAVTVMVPLSIGLLQISIINLFVERLRITFRGTNLSLSACTNYIFRIIFITAWISVLVFASFAVDASPFNIYKQEIAYDGTGITCSGLAKPNVLLSIAMALIGLCVLSTNIILWVIFIVKLKKIIQSTRQTTKISNDNEGIIQVMKEQTMIVTLTAFSTVFLWLFAAINLLGAFPTTLDFLVNIVVIFLSFKFNRYYYELCKCHLCTKQCCKCFERYCICSSMTNDELQLTKVNSQTKVSSKSQTSTTVATSTVAI